MVNSYDDVVKNLKFLIRDTDILKRSVELYSDTAKESREIVTYVDSIYATLSAEQKGFLDALGNEVDDLLDGIESTLKSIRR